MHCMPMLPLHVGWCLPLPIPSSKIALPTQKLISFLTRNSQPTCYPTQKLNKKLTSHTLPFPKNTPVKRCRLFLRSLDGSVARAPTPTRMVRATTAVHARPGARSAMSSWLAQWRLQQQGQQEWIVATRLALLHCQQLGLFLPGRWLPPPMGLSTGRGVMPPMGHLLWRVERPFTTGGLPNWGAIMQALLLAW
jgi:hypothetical protein